MTTLSDYKITEELYRGSNSLVYRAYRETDKQPVILKMLSSAYPSPEKVARFNLEYEIIRNLNLASVPSASAEASPGVVKAYSLVNDQHRWLMVLEDFGGEALAQLMKRRPFTLTQFLMSAIQIVAVLDQVHQGHVIHKDINPSNIVMNPATGQLKLIDFGISTLLPRERPTLRNPNVLEGTLAYISPEQTGRMNREIDYRTDFYSLGVTFYELLTGQLPFPSTDALELVHYHIAKEPSAPSTLNPGIPQPLSDIVLKLMAKNAEDRYQSAFSLKADLEMCLYQWQTMGRVDSFPLRQADVSSQFQIPQKLYGREREIELLLAAFERIAGVEMMLVSGYTGIGKSTLIQEVYKPITRQRGYFITGKFDPFQRATPYVSLLQAFRSLVRQLLTETEAEISAWREKLLRALGPNGQVVSAVIPEVELIIGPQPAVPDLPPLEAQNRFNLVFQNFIKVFTRPEHPLVIFLDDLQWADGASLKLLEVLMTASEGEYLFLIGAYRDNEVNETHPLPLTLAEIQKAGTTVNHIFLAALTLPHLVQLVADTLHCPPTQAKPLAELILAKTEGNPFFINEFLKSLYIEALISFDFQRGRWQWDLGQIRARGMTDNVADLMSHKVRRLGDNTQQVLKLAACVGNQFDLQTLAIVYQKSPQETSASLWEAMTEGLIVPLGDTYQLMSLDVQGLAETVMVEYKFAHDQIRQAVYSLIPEAEKQAVHRQVGQLLLQALKTQPEEQEQKVFDIVNQLNLGRELISEQSERHSLAELNLSAGKRAKASAAYQAAFNYFQIGLELLTQPHPSLLSGESADKASWERQYNLTLALHEGAAEAAYVNGDFEQMERYVEAVLQRARVLLDKLKVYEVKIQAHMAQNKLPEAAKTGLSVLKLLGVEFPEKPNKAQIGQDLVKTKLTLAGKRIEDLSCLPKMSDPTKLAAIRILKTINAAVFRTTPELFPLIVFKQVNLSVKHGNTPESAVAYANYAVILCGVLGDIEGGFRFAKLALDLLEQFNAWELKAKTLFFVNYFARPWKEHVRETFKPFLEGYQSGLETGDTEYAGYLITAYCTFAYIIGKELPPLEREMRLYGEAIIAKLKQESQYAPDINHQVVLNLIEPGEHPYHLKGAAYDEEQMLPLHLETNDLTVLSYFYLHKLILFYLFQQYPQAIKSATEMEKYLEMFTGLFFTAVFRFYESLAHLAVFSETPLSEQKRILRRVAANQKKLTKWAKHAPMNYLHKFYLVEAERARVANKDKDAREYYDKAINLAQANEYLNEEALANELAGRFYLARGQTRLAGHYLREAHYTYLRWGALAKVKDLEAHYPQFMAQAEVRSRELPISTTPTTDTGETASSILDLASVLKASQAISGEILLHKLLATLMKIVIENAGAQRGYLILEEEGRWVIEAEAKAEAEVKALQSVPIERSEKLPLAIINYVARTGENVVLSNANHEGMFTKDPYITQNQPKSILCSPLINQGKLTGLLYLENNLTTGAFTPNRLEVLNILSAQAAISIENARLYTHQVQMTNAASRFVPHEFLQILQKESIVKINLGDQFQQNMTILVSDIRSFTTLSEMMTPQENFDFVNAYLSRVSPIIRQHHGFIAKYMGDGLMAVFPGRVEDALDAAIAQLGEVARYNSERQQRGETPLQIGLGIHAGPVMLGTVGEVERMQLDLLSDAVNVTTRLEGLTKLYGVPLVISTEVLKRLADPGQYQIRFLGKTPLKGRQELLAVFEVFDGDPPEISTLKLETKSEFEKGLSLYHDWQFLEAKTHFEQVLQRYPTDKAAQFYLQRMADFSEDKLSVERNKAETLAEP